MHLEIVQSSPPFTPPLATPVLVMYTCGNMAIVRLVENRMDRQPVLEVLGRIAIRCGLLDILGDAGVPRLGYPDYEAHAIHNGSAHGWS